MLEDDELRKMFETEAVATAAALSLPVRIDKEPFDIPDPDDASPENTIWAEFWYEAGDPVARGHGGAKGRKAVPGIVQFTIYYPHEAGNGPALRMGGEIKKRWSQMQRLVGDAGYITLGPMGSRRLNLVREGWRPVVCRAEFQFHYDEPDAQDWVPLAG